MDYDPPCPAGPANLQPKTRLDRSHLTIVFAALAVSRWIDDATGWSIRRFVRTTRRYRIFQILAGPQTITAADPLPDDLNQAPPIHPRRPRRCAQTWQSQEDSVPVTAGGADPSSETHLLTRIAMAWLAVRAVAVRVQDLTGTETRTR